MPEPGGFTVSIEVDGQQLEEHAVQNDAHDSISCHIVSVPGQAFTIKILNDSPHVDAHQQILASALVYLDGTRNSINNLLGSCHVDYPRSLRTTNSTEIIITGFRVSNDSEKQLCFSQVQLTEDGSGMDGGLAESVGTIKVEIAFKKLTGPSAFDPISLVKPPVTLSERAKKGGGHCVALGAEIKKTTSFSSGTTLSHLPKYTFVFRHASKDWLQAKEIVAQPAPKPELKVDSEPPVSGPSRKRKAVKREAGAPQVIDLLSDSDWLEDEADRVAMRKLKEKVAARKRAKLQVKPEPAASSILKAPVINISD